MIERRYLLLYTYKAFIYLSIAAVIYIFIVGLFSPTITDGPTDKKMHRSFSLASLKNNSHTYFKIDRRELLVIKTNDKYSVFWAYDPIYGCRLEFLNPVIKPVCIDIQYNLDGFSTENNQLLLKPEYEIILKNELIVY